MGRKKEYFGGLDLSSTNQANKGKTICSIFVSHEEQIELLGIVALKDDRELISWSENLPFTSIGVDAPLSLPPCFQCFFHTQEHCCPWRQFEKEQKIPIGSMYFYRPSDIILRKLLPKVPPKPAISNGGPIDITPLTVRWMQIQKQLGEDHVFQEIYVSACVEILARSLGYQEKRRYPHKRCSAHRKILIGKLIEHCHLKIRSDAEVQIAYNDDAFDSFIAGLMAIFKARNMHFAKDTCFFLPNLQQTPFPLKRSTVQPRKTKR